MKMRREDLKPEVQRALSEGDRWGIEQHGDEFAPFCEMVFDLKPTNALEIGFRRGGTLAVWATLCSGKAIGVDLPDDFTIDRSRELYTSYPNVVTILRDSHDRTTEHQVANALNDDMVDLLFIDGDHSARGVRQDFEMYSHFVRAGGLVAFHDIQPNEGSIGVHHFWNELIENVGLRFTSFNINAVWGGIGVLYV